jgi:hypothetical protein
MAAGPGSIFMIFGRAPIRAQRRYGQLLHGEGYMDDRGLTPLMMAGNSRNIAQREVASRLANRHEAADVKPWASLSPSRHLGPL